MRRWLAANLTVALLILAITITTLVLVAGGHH